MSRWRRILRRIRWHMRSPIDNGFQADLDRLREERAHSLFLAQKGIHRP